MVRLKAAAATAAHWKTYQPFLAKIVHCENQKNKGEGLILHAAPVGLFLQTQHMGGLDGQVYSMAIFSIYGGP